MPQPLGTLSVRLSMRRGHQREGEIWQSRKEEAISSTCFCHFLGHAQDEEG